MSDQRQQYRNVIEMFFTTINGIQVTRRAGKSGFYILQDGQEKSVFTELGIQDKGKFYLPSFYEGNPVSLRKARTDYYCIIFPQDKALIALGKPPRIKLRLDEAKSRYKETTDPKTNITYTVIDEVFLNEVFEKVYHVS